MHAVHHADGIRLPVVMQCSKGVTTMGDPHVYKGECVMSKVTLDLFFHTGDETFGVVTPTFKDYSLYELYECKDNDVANTSELLVQMTNRFFQDRN